MNIFHNFVMALSAQACGNAAGHFDCFRLEHMPPATFSTIPVFCVFAGRALRQNSQIPNGKRQVFNDSAENLWRQHKLQGKLMAWTHRVLVASQLKTELQTQLGGRPACPPAFLVTFQINLIWELY